MGYRRGVASYILKSMGVTFPGGRECATRRRQGGNGMAWRHGLENCSVVGKPGDTLVASLSYTLTVQQVDESVVNIYGADLKLCKLFCIVETILLSG